MILIKRSSNDQIFSSRLSGLGELPLINDGVAIIESKQME